MKKTILLSLLFVYQLISVSAQTLLSDLRPGMDGSEPVFDNAQQRGNELFFIANPDGITPKLYKTDGTTGNTILLEGGDDMYIFMILGLLGDDLLYIAGDFLHGGQFALYKTNGNPGEGEFVIDYNQNNDLFIAYPMHIVKDNVLYFLGAEANTGFELWRTDGTATGTYLVKDINPGVESSILYITNEAVAQYFTELNGYIYFGAAEPVNGAELWRTDGTEAGTTMVANIETSTPQIAQMGSNPAFFCTYNNAVYFSAYRTVDGRELWKTDGTTAGTVLVKDISSGDGNPSKMTEYNGSLYFSAYHPNQGTTLYKSNGTTAGTNVVKAPDNGGPQDATSFVKFKGKLYFSDYNKLWYTDGTAAGTNFLPNQNLFSSVVNLLATTNYIYFIASNGGNNGAYRTTEVANQITSLTSANFEMNTVYPMFMVNNCLLLRGQDGTAGEEIYTVCNQNTQPLGLDELSADKLTVFPNPCVDNVTIRCEFDVTDIKALYLSSLSGNTIQVSFSSMNQNHVSIKGLSEFSAGIYFLSIEMNNGQKQQVKLVIE